MEFILWEELKDFSTWEWILLGIVVVLAIGAIVWLLVRPKKETKTDVRALTYGAICIALSFVLSYVKLFSAPQGGSVTLGSMLPLMLYANRFGWKRGLVAGLAYGLLQFLQKPEIYHWAQVLIDYPLAFTCLGLAGVCKPLPLGILIGAFGRFVCHTISGFLFFSEVLDGAALWVSVVYNGWYMLFDTLICLVLSIPLTILLKRTRIFQK